MIFSTHFRIRIFRLVFPYLTRSINRSVKNNSAMLSVHHTGARKVECVYAINMVKAHRRNSQYFDLAFKHFACCLYTSALILSFSGIYSILTLHKSFWR